MGSGAEVILKITSPLKGWGALGWSSVTRLVLFRSSVATPR